METSYLRPFNGRVTIIDSNPSPEVVAFSMSRFSRSADRMEKSLAKVLEYAEDRHAKFFEENYHDYGHASIGDQGHVAFAVQDVSMLAIFYFWQMLEIVDGQERSSRYQPFDKTGYSIFDTHTTTEKHQFSNVTDAAFKAYLKLHQATVEYYLELHPDSQLFAEGGGMTREQLAKQLNRNPDTITDAMLAEANHTQANRIRNARAFDVARYVLPLCTNTSAGYIMSARSAERIIALLHVHPWAEMRWLGQAIQEALLPHLPNLLKYTSPNQSEVRRQTALRQIAEEFISSRNPEPADFGATIQYPTRRALLNIAARLIYPYHNLSWATALAYLEESSSKLWQRILDEGGWQREPKEDFPRDGRGGELTVELVMDVGAARDYNRHRGAFKQYQWHTPGQLGWTFGVMQPEIPDPVLLSNISAQLDYMEACSLTLNTPYTLPLATKIRGVYHMSWPQLIYMLELRSAPSGHPAYRWLTAQMLEAINNVDTEMYRHLQTKLDKKLFRFTPYDAVKDKFFVR